MRSMEYHNLSFDKRIGENIKNYSLQKLYDLEKMKTYLTRLSAFCGAEFLLTDRHGGIEAQSDGYQGGVPDVVQQPGNKIRVADRTVAHLYVQVPGADSRAKEQAEQLLADTAELFSAFGQECYLHKELDEYSNELERRLEKEKYRVTHGDEEDVLTERSINLILKTAGRSSTVQRSYQWRRSVLISMIGNMRMIILETRRATA